VRLLGTSAGPASTSTASSAGAGPSTGVLRSFAVPGRHGRRPPASTIPASRSPN